MNIESQQQRMELKVTKMIDELYSCCLRKMQGEMHACASRCCDDKRGGTMDSVQKCIDRCANPLLRVQDYLQKELRQFEAQLQNCIMVCNDGIRPDMNKQKASDLSKYQQEFEQCTVQCVDQFIRLVPKLQKSMQHMLEKGL